MVLENPFVRFRHRAWRGTAAFAALLTLTLVNPARAGGAESAATIPASTASTTQAGAATGVPNKIVGDPNYKLGAGDHLRVIVFGQPDLSGEFQVDGSGNVALPLIGNVAAGGTSAGELETSIAQKLTPDYLRDPRVSVEVITYRPFYIVGEVKSPGNYAYTNGMTVINAVAMAGGFTYRARDDEFDIARAGGTSRESEEATQQTKVYPGDVITVRERWF